MIEPAKRSRGFWWHTERKSHFDRGRPWPNLIAIYQNPTSTDKRKRKRKNLDSLSDYLLTVVRIIFFGFNPLLPLLTLRLQTVASTSDHHQLSTETTETLSGPAIHPTLQGGPLRDHPLDETTPPSSGLVVSDPAPHSNTTTTCLYDLSRPIIVLAHPWLPVTSSPSQRPRLEPQPPKSLPHSY